MCPAGGRDGRRVSLLCHHAAHAYISITVPKPRRTAEDAPLAPLNALVSAPLLQEGTGVGRRGHWNWSWQRRFRDSWTPISFLLLLPAFSRKKVQACPSDPSCPGRGLALVRDLRGPQWALKEARAGTLPFLPGYARFPPSVIWGRTEPRELVPSAQDSSPEGALR